MEPDPKRFKEAPKPLNPFPAREGPSGEPLAMESVVSVVDFGRVLDAAKFKDVQATKRTSMRAGSDRAVERFQGVVLRKNTLEGDIKAVVFSSGRIVCTGAKSEPAARSACTAVLNVVKNVSFAGKPPAALPTSEVPKAQYFVASFETGYALQLEHFALQHSKDIVYEPEVFPALVYKFPQSRVVAYVYPHGKVLLSSPSQESLADARRTMQVLVSRFRRSKYGKGKQA